MADFDTDLTALFRQEADPALGQRLADAAIDQIDHEDRRRRLVLGVGSVAGLVMTGVIVGESGALSMLKSAAVAVPYLSVLPWVWPTAAVAVALYAVTSIRSARTT